jgi:hypothetical protein
MSVQFHVGTEPNTRKAAENPPEIAGASLDIDRLQKANRERQDSFRGTKEERNWRHGLDKGTLERRL